MHCWDMRVGFDHSEVQVCSWGWPALICGNVKLWSTLLFRQGEICRNHRALQREMDWEECKTSSRRRQEDMRFVWLVMLEVPEVQCHCLGKVSSLLVSDPRKTLKDVPSNVFFCVSLRAGERWKCAMQLGRCYTALSSEVVSRDTELGIQSFEHRGAWGGNAGGVADTGIGKKKEHKITKTFVCSFMIRSPWFFTSCSLTSLNIYALLKNKAFTIWNTNATLWFLRAAARAGGLCAVGMAIAPGTPAPRGDAGRRSLLRLAAV